MSKKDYIALGKLVGRWYHYIPPGFIVGLCDFLESDNSQFNRNKFCSFIHKEAEQYD